VANCEKIREELKRIVDFRIGEGASRRHPLIFNKKTFFPALTGAAIFTDGEKIYLPLQFSLCRDESDNQMMVANAVRHESDHIKEFIKLHRKISGSDKYNPKYVNRFLEDFFLQDHFRENSTLAHEIFNIVEDNRIDRRAREELPGLRRFSEEKERRVYLSRRPSPKYLLKKGRKLDAFREFFLEKTLLDETVDEVPEEYQKLLKECVDIARSAEGKDIYASFAATKKIYDKFKENFDIKGPMTSLPPFGGRGHDKMYPGIPRRYRGSVKPGEGRGEEERKAGQGEGEKIKKEENRKEGRRSFEEAKGIEREKEMRREDQAKADREKKGREKGQRKEEGKREKRKEGEGEQDEKEKSFRDQMDEGKRTEKRSEDLNSRYDPHRSRPLIRLVPKPTPGVNLKVPKPSLYDVRESQRIISKYDGEIRAIESYFKKLEERYRGKKMAKEGEEIDIGEYVQAELEYEATGVRPAKKKIFRKRAPVKRKVAWAILADISASTGFGFGYRVIDSIKEALLIQGEALSYSGYPFGIFAFHSGGNTLRELMEYKDTVYVIKDFEEDYTPENRARVMSLYPYGGTLMVNAIKYVSDKLKKIEGRPKGLSIITDGEPDVPEEVRALLQKLPEDGILPFLFVIGSEHEKFARSLMSEYVIIKKDKIKELPNEVLRIFTTYGIMK